MFIKLNFSSTKSIGQVHHLMHHIVENPSIVDVPSFVASAAPLFTGGTYTGFDPATSEIIRTNSPTTVVSRISKIGSANIGSQALQFVVQSMPSMRYYMQFAFDAGSITYRMTDTITGGSDITTRSNLAESANWASTDSGGLAVSLSTSSTNLADIFDGVNSTHNTSNIRTAWFYITDTCFISAFTLTNGFVNGWPTSYGTSNLHGPMIFSQYQPFDAFMIPENGIVPVMLTTTFRGGGFNLNNDISQITNVLFTKPTSTNGSSPPFQILNGVDATPLASSSWPRLRSPIVSWGSGSRTNDQFPLVSEALGSTTSLSVARYGRVLNTTVGVRYPSNNRLSTGNALLPLRWESSWHNLRGGNASALGGFYLFNGDYVAGDEFIFNDKRYMIWPTQTGFAQRVGIAIPKE